MSHIEQKEQEHIAAYQQGRNDRQANRPHRAPRSDGTEWAYNTGWHDGKKNFTEKKPPCPIL